VKLKEGEGGGGGESRGERGQFFNETRPCPNKGGGKEVYQR